MAYSASSSAPPNQDPAHALNMAEISWLHGIIADMVGSPSKDAHFGMPIGSPYRVP